MITNLTYAFTVNSDIAATIKYLLKLCSKNVPSFCTAGSFSLLLFPNVDKLMFHR